MSLDLTTMLTIHERQAVAERGQEVPPRGVVWAQRPEKLLASPVEQHVANLDTAREPRVVIIVARVFDICFDVADTLCFKISQCRCKPVDVELLVGVELAGAEGRSTSAR